MFSLFSILLAALGLGLLVFIHELGHYWMARKEGMTVEVFSIGFGKPLHTWTYQGVKWQICVLPFGGYVRIAGMEKKGNLEPYQIPDGFYGKKPWARIKVALAGPCINIAFAFFAFTLLWASGGRLKPFSEWTRIIGWVDPTTPLFQAGVRPGDQIQELNHKPFHQFQDLLYASLLDEAPPQLKGVESGMQTPFTYTFSWEKDASAGERLNAVFGSLSPASYLIYGRHPIGDNSPMEKSGIRPNDRILWVDGDIAFSKEQLIALVNQPKALLTVERQGTTFLARAPRLKIADLRLNPAQKAELQDWQHFANLSNKPNDLFFIPYDLTSEGVVEGPLSYLNDESMEAVPAQERRSSHLEAPLQKGDRIIAVDGVSVRSSQALLSAIQTKKVHLIVREGEEAAPLPWKTADAAFLSQIDWVALNALANRIGTDDSEIQSGPFKLIGPVVPTPRDQYPYPEEIKERLARSVEEQKKAIEEMNNEDEKARALQLLEEGRHQLMLGIMPVDREVIYNPSPFVLFTHVFKETFRTLFALFSGSVSPKYMQGPVGIVQVMHHSWMVGAKEGLFWLGMISLNLGLLNLLPVPVLDGGHICFSLWEKVTGKPIKAKTMERLIIPFVVLLITLFVYLTYNDLLRLFSRFF